MPTCQLTENGIPCPDDWCQRHTITEILKDERIVAITRPHVGVVHVQEACDHYYGVVMTPDHLRQWAAELVALAERVEREAAT